MFSTLIYNAPLRSGRPITHTHARPCAARATASNNECTKSHTPFLAWPLERAQPQRSNLSTIKINVPRPSTLLSASINLRAALLERLDHQPRHPPKKGIRDCGVNRVRKRE